LSKAVARRRGGKETKIELAVVVKVIINPSWGIQVTVAVSNQRFLQIVIY
jgi:hypothetical protein